MTIWQALGQLDTAQVIIFFLALSVAFGFEFINGFHDTANAVATVIYTRTLEATPAVVYSGFCNFLGVLLGGTGVAFGIVYLLPVDVLVASDSSAALVMVMALLVAGVTWNLGTWALALPVSSSHTLIGSILGVGLANSLLAGNGLSGVRWDQATKTGLALLLSPLIGFLFTALLYKLARRTLRDPRLYQPPPDGEKPPRWVRGVLIGTCGGVSLAHGSNDGQKGMGLILLVLIGFLPVHYALNSAHTGEAARVSATAQEILRRDQAKPVLTAEEQAQLAFVVRTLEGKQNFPELPETTQERWELRRALLKLSRVSAHATPQEQSIFRGAVEFVPFWVVLGVALALGIGTTIGYRRIVITVAEKIGSTHLTYSQGSAAELATACTIFGADLLHMPVSTTQTLSSGIAGSMWAAGSALQRATVRKILIAWVLTLPVSMLLSGGLYMLGRQLFL
jgi:phosphate/sulfate permease